MASWPVWLAAALIVSAGLTFTSARAPRVYQASVIMRVTEGQVAIPGSELGRGALKNHLSELVFTSAHLMELMRRHPGHYGDLKDDPASALENIRGGLTIAVTENDFNEEREPDDPPRSARLQIAYDSRDPEFAFTIATELADMIVTSTLGKQRKQLEREQAAAQALAGRAEADLAELVRGDPMVFDFRTRAARDRVGAAKQQVTAATLALRALTEQQALRFEVIDPGRVPERVDRLSAAVSTFFSTLFTTLLAGLLLAGAFDPRVLDAQDLINLDVTVLGRLPALPHPRRA
jgi:hypothetical protein